MHEGESMGECWEAMQNVFQLAISGLSEASDAQEPPSNAASFNGSTTSGYAAIPEHGNMANFASAKSTETADASRHC